MSLSPNKRLVERMLFIKEALGIDDVEEKCRKAFCEKYGEKADIINNNRQAEEDYIWKWEVMDHYTSKHPACIFRFSPGFIVQSLNHKAGLYSMFDSKGNILYIGKSVNLASRIPQSLKRLSIEWKCHPYEVKYHIVENPADIDILELLYIAKYKPVCNLDSKGNSTMFNSILDTYCDIDLWNAIPIMKDPCNLSKGERE